MSREPVMHFEIEPGRSACGRELPTAGFYTEDAGIMEDRAGSRCKSCWRVMLVRGLAEPDPEDQHASV